MQIDFNEREIHVQVICGALEEYKPNRKIKIITDKVKKLKEEVDAFMKEVVTPELNSIRAMVKEENEKYIKNKKDTKLNDKTEEKS